MCTVENLNEQLRLVWFYSRLWSTGVLKLWFTVILDNGVQQYWNTENYVTAILGSIK